jgi:hypothetical protein
MMTVEEKERMFSSSIPVKIPNSLPPGSLVVDYRNDTLLVTNSIFKPSR